MIFYGTWDVACIYSNRSIDFLESTSDSFHVWVSSVTVILQPGFDR